MATSSFFKKFRVESAEACEQLIRDIEAAELKEQQQKEHLRKLREGTANILENSGFAKAIHENRDKVEITFGE